MRSWLAASSVLLLLSAASTYQVTAAQSAIGRPSVVDQSANPSVQPPRARPLGGVQLDVEPRAAQVFVDGNYAGLVDEFAGYYRHLRLPAGNHRLEIFRSGFLPLTFEVNVIPDRTITYRQSLIEVAHGF